MSAEVAEPDVSVSYRLAGWRDLWEVRRLQREVFPEPYALWRFVGYHLSNQAWIWVAESAGQMVGYLVLTLSFYRDPRRMVGEIISVAVRPAHRRRGIATTLLRQAIAQAWQVGVGQCYLQVAVSNLAAQDLYRAEGFRNERRLAGYYLDGSDAWLMVLERPSLP